MCGSAHFWAPKYMKFGPMLNFWQPFNSFMQSAWNSRKANIDNSLDFSPWSCARPSSRLSHPTSYLPPVCEQLLLTFPSNDLVLEPVLLPAVLLDLGVDVLHQAVPLHQHVSECGAREDSHNLWSLINFSPLLFYTIILGVQTVMSFKIVSCLENNFYCSALNQLKATRVVVKGHHTSGVTISYPGAEIGKAVKVPSKDPVNCRLVPNWTSMALDKILWDKTTTIYYMALFGSECLEYYVDVSNKKNHITFSHSSPVQRP